MMITARLLADLSNKVQNWDNYTTNDYYYNNSDCNRLRLHFKVTTITIMDTMYMMVKVTIVADMHSTTKCHKVTSKSDNCCRFALYDEMSQSHQSKTIVLMHMTCSKVLALRQQQQQLERKLSQILMMMMIGYQ